MRRIIGAAFMVLITLVGCYNTAHGNNDPCKPSHVGVTEQNGDKPCPTTTTTTQPETTTSTTSMPSTTTVPVTVTLPPNPCHPIRGCPSTTTAGPTTTAVPTTTYPPCDISLNGVCYPPPCQPDEPCGNPSTTGPNTTVGPPTDTLAPCPNGTMRGPNGVCGPITDIGEPAFGTLPSAPCQEDQPCWNCRTMGNQLCGPGGASLPNTGAAVNGLAFIAGAFIGCGVIMATCRRKP